MEKTIIVNDKMQSGYSYKLVEEEGMNFSSNFKPELSPKEMLLMGVFEGKYLNDCIYEFPLVWFKDAKLSLDGKANISLNFFKTKSRQPLSVWRKRGWILGPDPRGWFQWYCRYYMGRRIPDIDAIQIKRWRAFYRHKAQILKNCMGGDVSCRIRQRQALIQWAYNPMF